MKTRLDMNNIPNGCYSLTPEEAERHDILDAKTIRAFGINDICVCSEFLQDGVRKIPIGSPITEQELADWGDWIEQFELLDEWNYRTARTFYADAKACLQIHSDQDEGFYEEDKWDRLIFILTRIRTLELIKEPATAEAIFRGESLSPEEITERLEEAVDVWVEKDGDCWKWAVVGELYMKTWEELTWGKDDWMFKIDPFTWDLDSY
jgi:hypothetical protein